MWWPGSRSNSKTVIEVQTELTSQLVRYQASSSTTQNNDLSVIHTIPFAWLFIWGLTPFSTLFQLYHGGQCTNPCFPRILLNSTPHNILSKPLASFPHYHCCNNGQRWEMNPVTMTIINPGKKYWLGWGSNQRARTVCIIDISMSENIWIIAILCTCMWKWWNLVQMTTGFLIWQRANSKIKTLFVCCIIQVENDDSQEVSVHYRGPLLTAVSFGDLHMQQKLSCIFWSWSRNLTTYHTIQTFNESERETFW